MSQDRNPLARISVAQIPEAGRWRGREAVVIKHLNEVLEEETTMQTITPYVLYQDVEAALGFLQKAFGFEETLRYAGEEGYVNHAEMQLGDGTIYLGDPGDQYRNPRELGQETVGISVLVDDVDAHFQQAKAAGAEIREEPTDQEYGERRYIAKDAEGHVWFFAQPTREVAPEEWGATVA